MRTFALAALIALSASPASAAVPREGQQAMAAHAVDTLIAELNSYVHPQVARTLQARLRKERPRLVRIADRDALVEALNAILAESKDLHLKARVDTVQAGAGPAPAALSDTEEALLQRQLAHGLMAVRRLPGNIGYLKLRHFSSEPEGARLVDEAMTMLKDTGALIIDLRENTGGGGASDERLLGHLSAQPLQMEVIHWRDAGGNVTTAQRKVSVPSGGPLYPAKPIFLLTANRTFSAAEAFAYGLKAEGRVTIVGERTRGGANPANRPVLLGNGISVFIPNGLVEHPITRGNWEGTGVTPDVPTDPRLALVEAYRRALAVAEPLVVTPKSSKELEDARADPEATLRADAGL